jgi:hypothetical protein
VALIPDVVDDDPIESSWGNSIRNQGVQVTTSGARPSSPSEGMVIYETDTDMLLMYTGSAWIEFARHGVWTDYTPTLAQGVTVTKTVNYARYVRFGRTIHAQGLVSVTSTGTAASAISMGFPVTPATAGILTNRTIGSAWIADNSAGLTHPAFAVIFSGPVIVFISSTAAVNNYEGVSIFSAALASGDQISWAISYEAAS